MSNSQILRFFRYKWGSALVTIKQELFSSFALVEQIQVEPDNLAAFLQTLEEDLKKEHKLSWIELMPSPSMEEPLKSLGWSVFPSFTRYHFILENFCPSWLEMTSSDVIPWRDLSDADKDRLQAIPEQGHCHPSLNPFSKGFIAHEETSFFVKNREGAYGWCATSLVAAGVLSYAKLYVSRLRSAVPLISACVRKQKEIEALPFAIFDVSSHSTSRVWRNFVNKRLSPLAARVEVIKKAVK